MRPTLQLPNALVRVLVLDRSNVVRQGLRFLLPQVAHGRAIEMLESASREQAVAHLRKHSEVALAVVEWDLVCQGTPSALEKLHEARPELPVVVMAAEAEASDIRRAFECGARGFIPKSSRPQLIAAALRLVLCGGDYIPPDFMARPMPVEPGHQDANALIARLGTTPRQSQILALLLAGKSNKAISRELGLAEGTVKNHVAALLRILGVRSRVEAIIAAGRSQAQ